MVPRSAKTGFAGLIRGHESDRLDDDARFIVLQFERDAAERRRAAEREIACIIEALSPHDV